MSFFSMAQPEEGVNAKVGVDVAADKNINLFDQPTGANQLYTFQPRQKDIEGSPFLVDGYSMGNLVTVDTFNVVNIQLKYNVHEDCVEITKKKQRTNLFAHKIKKFDFYDVVEARQRTFMNGFNNYLDNYSPLSYYEVLYDGDVKLLVKHDKPVMRMGSKISAPGINTNTATKQYSYIKRIYLKDGETYHRIKYKRSSILTAIGSPELKKYLKENKIRCRTAESVTEAIKQYEKLKKAKEEEVEEK